MIRIFKFGGASVKDAAGVRNLVQVVEREGQINHLVIVVSAMGKTTNALESIYQKAFAGQPFAEELEALKTYHRTTAADLFSPESEDILDGLDRYFTRLQFQLLHSPTLNYELGYDQVISFGEYLSTFLVYRYLKRKGLPVVFKNARFLIKTDLTWKEGTVNPEETSKAIQSTLEPLLASNIVITQGFIGGTKTGFLTTLGREGSDYTAAILGNALDAESVTIWKDVPGVLNADPKWLEGAVLLPQLSYLEAAELTYYGATVIHPKTIRPLAQKEIPLYVRSFLDAAKPGTRVGMESQKWTEPAFIAKHNLTLLSFSSRDFSFMDEKNITEVLHLFTKLNLKVHILQVSATSISVATELEVKALDLIKAHLKAHYSVLYNDNLTLITIKNYTPESIDFVAGQKPIILEQRTRTTCRLLIRST